ncbi:hypothetical protein AAF712_006729 [Marasmius tenuissimus]|uniref:SH3 domain-containing protein n=1 Tax=Marasmius tenuissimus TaxID=585030 RepID=A0ABR2ZY68_9AGAR
MQARRAHGNAAMRHRRSLDAREPVLGLPSLPIVDPLLNPIVTGLLGGGNGNGDGGNGNGGGQPSTTIQQQPTTTAQPPSSTPTTTAPPNTGSGSSGTSGGGGTTTSPGNGNSNGNGSGNGSGSGNGAVMPMATAMEMGMGMGLGLGLIMATAALEVGVTGTQIRTVMGMGLVMGTQVTVTVEERPIMVRAAVTTTTTPEERLYQWSIPTLEFESWSSCRRCAAPQLIVHICRKPAAVTGSGVSSSAGISSGGSTGGLGGSSGGSGNTNMPPGGGNGGTTEEAGAASKPSQSLAPGAIAGIVLASLAGLLVILVLIRRRRLIQTRLRRRNQWSAVDSRSYDFGNVNSPDPTLRSARSSFATTYDQSFPSDFSHQDPQSPVPVPQMAELRDTHMAGTLNQRLSGVPTSPRSPPPPILVHIETTNDSHQLTRQDSNNSVRSITTDPYSQGQVVYLPIQDASGHSPATPMSVRPFSPSEAFSFPKPPTSAGTTRESWASAPSHMSQEGVATMNPFADPQAAVSSPVIKRPFHPNRDDELAVAAGDRVSIIQVFDDGWVAVRKHEDIEGKGKGKAESAPGLIPADCFREQGQPMRPELLGVGHGI